MKKNDTSLIRMVIQDISEKYALPYELALDEFYHSRTCALISDESTGAFTFAPKEIVAIFDEVDR